VVLHTGAVLGTSLWLFGDGASGLEISAAHPTGQAATCAGLSGDSAVSSCVGASRLWLGTSGGAIHWTADGTAWSTAADRANVPVGAAVTALAYLHDALWAGLTDTDGAVEDLFEVTRGCGSDLWCAGDEGDRTVIGWPEPWTVTNTGTLYGPEYEAEAITLIYSWDTPAVTILEWFSAALPVRQHYRRLAQHDGLAIVGLLDIPYDRRLWMDDRLLVGDTGDVDPESWYDLVIAEDAALGREAGTVLPVPGVATHVLIASDATTPDATLEFWVTTRYTSFDLADYQRAPEGVLVPLQEPGSVVRVLARMVDGDTFTGVAVMLGTEV